MLFPGTHVPFMALLLTGPTRLPAAPAPAIAYRRDLEARAGEAFGPSDGAWIEATVHLAHAARSRASSASLALTGASDVAAQVISQFGVSREVGDDDRLTAILDMIADMEDAGALQLATCALVNLYPLVSDLLERGRIIAQFARVNRKRGDLEAATVWLHQVQELGWAADERVGVELLVRSWIGFGALAQVTGNYPAMSTWTHRAVRLAHAHGLDRLEATARGGLFVRSAMRGRAGVAVLHAKRMLGLAAGDARIEAEILTNVARLLLDRGELFGAKAASAAVMVRTRAPRFLLPALGSYALACARLHQAGETQWSLTEIQRADHPAYPPYERTMVLADATQAARVIGWADRALVFEKRVVELAARYHVNEALFTKLEERGADVIVQTMDVRDHPALRQPIQTATRELAAFQPATLPSQVLITL